MIDNLFEARRKASLTKRELEFLDFCAGSGKTFTLAQFRNFWLSLSEKKQHDLKFAYMRSDKR